MSWDKLPWEVKIALTTPEELLGLGPVIPVAVLEDAGSALPLARALLAGGLRTLEITLRTPAALEAIACIAQELPEIAVGAGTLLSRTDIDAALSAGAQFLVSPGTPPALAEALRDSGRPALPGAATATEMLQLRDLGFTCQKFFPAEAAGGAAALKALAGPLPDIRFCPTGGIAPATAPGYLALPNVACVGGSWLTPPELVAAENWTAVAELARQAARLTG